MLIVDDDACLLDVMSDAITASGRRTVKLRSFAEMQSREEEALACDVAFLDVNLGGGKPSGIDAARWLRQHRFKGHIYFLTAHAGSHPLMLRASAVEGASLLAKPITLNKLAALVNGAVP